MTAAGTRVRALLWLYRR